MGKKFEIVGNDISDGYHTFDELYTHRCLLFINLCLAHVGECAWRVDPDVNEWFLLYWDSSSGQMSYHIPNKFLYLVKNQIPERADWIWDGHTSKAVVARLEAVALKKVVHGKS